MMNNFEGDTLSILSLKSGLPAKIKCLDGDPVILERLRELGFLSGETVQVKGRSIFGSPIVVQVQGVTVALRKEEAQCILL